MIEDGGGSAAEAEIAGRFGTDVAEMVRANSDTDVESKPPWRERKEAYLAGVATKPIGAVRVSIADKLHNARSILLDHRRIGDEIWDRFTADRDGMPDPQAYADALRDSFAALKQAALGAAGERAPVPPVETNDNKPAKASRRKTHV